MSYPTRRAAQAEADDLGEIFCLNCKEYVTFEVVDNSFGHAFGTQHQYDIGCPKCGSYNWSIRGYCQLSVKLPSGRYACDSDNNDVCRCDLETREDCQIWEPKEKNKRGQRYE